MSTYIKPSLISNSVLKNIDKLFVEGEAKPSFFATFYESYIEPYSFALCSFFILFIFLFIRYHVTQNKKNKTSKKQHLS